MLAAKASRQLGLDGARHLLRRAGLALPLSLAAAAGGPDRDGLRRAGAALAADPRRLRRAPASTSATRSIRARTCTTASPSRCSSSASATTALRHQLRPVALRAAAARLSRLHRHLPRAHQGLPRQGRRVQPDRAAGRLWRLPGLGRPRRAVPLARRRPGRLRRHLLEARRNTTTTAGRCSNGSAASSIPRTARARAREFIAEHIIRVTDEGLRRFRRRRRRRRPPTAACSGST